MNPRWDWIIDDILQEYPEATIADAAQHYGLDLEAFVTDLERAVLDDA